MAVTVALWLAAGAAIVVLAWMATPDSFPQGALSCLIAGVGGAFVGGELSSYSAAPQPISRTT